MRIRSRILGVFVAASIVCFSGGYTVRNVSARADGYYYQGHFTANVSDYLTIRAEADVYSQALGYYYPGESFYVIGVYNGFMGKVEYASGQFGYVNLYYALEKYESDLGVINRVPTRYSSVTWRSEANTYSDPLGYLFPGDLISVWNVQNRIMCQKIIGGESGWVNLDYTEFYANPSYK